MAFRDREDYETWKLRRGTSEPSRQNGEPGDIELRLSPLYAILTLFLGLVFTVLGVVPFGKGGPTFRTMCLVVGVAALAGGLVMLRNRRVIVRMTSRALHLREAVIPWASIQRFEREHSRRNFWIHVYLKEKRTDLGPLALKARAALRALGGSADFDYTIMENDLPRSGPWFIEECQRRIAAAEAKPS